jgi:hypothetical protein
VLRILLSMVLRYNFPRSWCCYICCDNKNNSEISIRVCTCVLSRMDISAFSFKYCILNEKDLNPGHSKLFVQRHSWLCSQGGNLIYHTLQTLSTSPHYLIAEAPNARLWWLTPGNPTYSGGRDQEDSSSKPK